MHPIRKIQCLGVTLFAWILTCDSHATVLHSERNFFSNSVGLMMVWEDEFISRGSGVVAWDPKLVFSCAHVISDDGLWSSDPFSFHPGYNSPTEPSSELDGIALRSYRYFAEYSSNVVQRGGNSKEAYDLDFVIFHANQDVADAYGYWTDGGGALASDRWKLIAGYPATIRLTGEDGFYYQHSTDFFTQKAFKFYRSYYDLGNVTTGSGNSGGPVFVYDGDIPYLAGILVSGDRKSVGVRALDADTKSMAENLLGVDSKTRTFRNSSSFMLPDGARKFSSRSVEVSGFSSNVKSLKFGLDISTTYRGDLEVYLKSPTGRIHWISKRKGGRAKNLVVKNADYSKKFAGFAANGKWTLHMRDASKHDRARYKNFSLTISGP
jgi:subtilisin-like proprotein convertase family protein